MAPLLPAGPVCGGVEESDAVNSKRGKKLCRGIIVRAVLRMFFPALFTKMSSRPPKAALAAATRLARSAATLTSATQPLTLRPAAEQANGPGPRFFCEQPYGPAATYGARRPAETRKRAPQGGGDAPQQARGKAAWRGRGGDVAEGLQRGFGPATLT